MDWPTIQKRMPWSLVLLLGGGFTLAKACDVSGLTTISHLLSISKCNHNLSWPIQASPSGSVTIWLVFRIWTRGFFSWSSALGQQQQPKWPQTSPLPRSSSQSSETWYTFSCLQSLDYLRNSDPFSVRGYQDSSPLSDDASNLVLLLRLHASRGDSAQRHSLLGLRNEHKGHGMLDNFSLLS